MNEFEGCLEQMKESGLVLPQKLVCIKTPNAETVLRNAFTYFLSLENKPLIWLTPYFEVVNWLENNEGKGLLLYGTGGQGKSLLGRFIIPAIFLKYHQKIINVFDVQKMNKDIDAVISYKLISIDDIGTEEISNTYGNKRMAFAEIIDEAEKQGKLIIISSNLTAEQFEKIYGLRIFDRLCKITKRVLFEGKSLRN